MSGHRASITFGGENEMKLPLPKISTFTEMLEEGLSLDEMEERVHTEIQNLDEVLEQNKENFKKDLRKMKLCYYLQCFKQAYTPPFSMSLPLNKHFSWCPHYDWFPEEK